MNTQEVVKKVVLRLETQAARLQKNGWLKLAADNRKKIARILKREENRLRRESAT